ncbi:MAG: YkgJ family cysteine cluster protein [Infirmifilum sp.]
MDSTSCNVELDCRDEKGYCGKCCRRAVVPLLKSDLEKIEKALGDPHLYVEWIDGIPVLKRKNNACIFLDPETGKCRIYEFRPLACRLYPLIYAPGLWVFPDPLCPRSREVSRDTIARCAFLVERFPEMLKRDWIKH